MLSAQYDFGGYYPRRPGQPSAIVSYGATRQLLERLLRFRVQQGAGNVDMRSGIKVEGLLFEGGRVAGV